MSTLKFGSWKVTASTIEWAGKGLNRFVIDRETLVETKKTEPLYEDLYKWIVLATEEDWLNADELYDLNFAFVYAAGAWNQNLDYELFDKTMEYQFEQLDEEEESQF